MTFVLQGSIQQHIKTRSMWPNFDCLDQHIQYLLPRRTSGYWPRPAFPKTSRWPVPCNSSLPQAISLKYACPLLVDTCNLHPLADRYMNEYFYKKMFWKPTNWSLTSVCHESVKQKMKAKHSNLSCLVQLQDIMKILPSKSLKFAVSSQQ